MRPQLRKPGPRWEERFLQWLKAFLPG